MTPLQQEIVEEFGSIYESYGFKRLQGMIVGLLLTRDDPASLDDIVELLGHSKGPISVATRRLADIGVIRQVNGPINRRNYYAAHPDLFFNNFKFNMETVRKNRRLAERMLERAETGGEAEGQAMRDNMERMRAFYSLMESFYENFSAAWVKKRRELAADQPQKVS